MLKHHQRKPITRLRLRVCLAEGNYQESITTRLISHYGLAVNITHALFAVEGAIKQFDMELVGPVPQLQMGLAYLASINAKIQGKANADGDSWHY